MPRRPEVLKRSHLGNFLLRNRQAWGRILLVLLLCQAVYVFKARYVSVQEQDSEKAVPKAINTGHNLPSLFSHRNESVEGKTADSSIVQSGGGGGASGGKETGGDGEEVGMQGAGEGGGGLTDRRAAVGALVEIAGFRVQDPQAGEEFRSPAGESAGQLADRARLTSETKLRQQAEEQAGAARKRQLAEGGDELARETMEDEADQGLSLLKPPVRHPAEIATEDSGSDETGLEGAGQGMLRGRLGEGTGLRQTVTLSGGSNRALPGVSNAQGWKVPLQEPGGGMTCEAWLEAEDRVDYRRDFEKMPIVVGNSETKTWDCAVGCRHLAGGNSNNDAFFGHGTRGARSVLRSMEARSYYGINDPDLAHKRGYEVVMTVHLDSDVPVGYFSWEEYEVMRPVQKKDAWPAPAVAFISNCHANNFRLKAIEKLQAIIPVDSYGRCSNNRPSQDDKLETISHYKFCLAFENSCEEDYVTEKFWQALVAGCVPVVVGAPNIHHFVPANDSIVHIESVESVEAAAAEIRAIFQDEARWKRMMAWKRSGPSDQFKALLDMSAVHSSCRLCIHMADKLRQADEQERKGKRPCRCRETGAPGKSEVVYHIYVRERGTFYLTSIFLRKSRLTLGHLKSNISATFRAQNRVPVWRSKRPKVLHSDKDLDLNIYRIYPVGSSQKAGLYGDAWFRNDTQLRDYLDQHPCADLEVVFV